jgi:hypothetical protein
VCCFGPGRKAGWSARAILRRCRAGNLVVQQAMAQAGLTRLPLGMPRQAGEGALMLRTVMAILAAAAISTPLAAQPLTVVEVNAPAVNCVFQPSCTITVSDTVGAIALPYIATPGTAWLQSRIYNSAPGTPAAGKTGYVYRVSLTEASGSADCLLGLVLNFGPVAKLPYKAGPLADVFVVTTGGLGTIGIKSAEKTGDIIEFEFAKPLCLAGGPDIRNTTFFFGLAANTAPAPKAVDAQIYAFGSPSFYAVEARVPTH